MSHSVKQNTFIILLVYEFYCVFCVCFWCLPPNGLLVQRDEVSFGKVVLIICHNFFIKY